MCINKSWMVLVVPLLVFSILVNEAFCEFVNLEEQFHTDKAATATATNPSDVDGSSTAIGSEHDCQCLCHSGIIVQEAYSLNHTFSNQIITPPFTVSKSVFTLMLFHPPQTA